MRFKIRLVSVDPKSLDREELVGTMELFEAEAYKQGAGEDLSPNHISMVLAVEQTLNQYQPLLRMHVHADV